MATDRSLTTLLRALQRPSDEHDASRLLGSATTLLTLLSNPLNLTLLSSQLLLAPAVWKNPDGLQIPLRVLSVINTASVQLVRNEADTHQGRFAYPARDGLDRVEWARAVARGADEKSPKWKHLLILGGLLVGFESNHRHGLPQDLRKTLEASLVDAANEALLDKNEQHDVAAGSITLVLGHALSLLSDHEKLRLRHDLLLSILGQQLFFSKDGLQSGYFLGIADKDIIQIKGSQFNWSVKSTSFYLLQKLAKGPLVSAFGSMSRLMALCVERVNDVDLLVRTVDRLAEFTRSLIVQWRQNKLSELDQSDEAQYLDNETRSTTLPEMWRVLRSAMFAIVVVQQALMGRVLGDGRIAISKHPYLAVQTLHMLRNIYFISSRLGHHAFTQYTFLYMTSIDVLSRYPTQAEAFLSECRPRPVAPAAAVAASQPTPSVHAVPAHPLDRCLDLYFFNTAEHFPLVLSPAANDSLLLSAAQPYLYAGESGDARLVPIFEAAHSLVLAVLSAPQDHDLAARRLPEYLDVLLNSFPSRLSARQFRLAIKTLVRIASPPNLLSQTQPLLASSILEVINSRFFSSSEQLLPPTPQQSSVAAETGKPIVMNDDAVPQPSVKAVMLLTIIDSLSVLSLDALDEWLPLVAASLPSISDGSMRETCRRRLWDVLSNGDMDVPRAEICVAWWNSRGGREQVLGLVPVGVSLSQSAGSAGSASEGAERKQKEKQEYMMSGAMPEQSKL